MGCGNSKPADTVETDETKKNVLLEEANGAKPFGIVEMYAAYPSMNSMGAVMLTVEEQCGKVVPTEPGEATNTPEFLAINPFHAVPAIRNDKFCCAESNAILRYLSMKYAHKLYFNLTNQRRALIDWSMDRFESMIYPDVVTCIYPLIGFAEAPVDQKAAGSKASNNLSKFAEVFLKEKFIGGPDLSIADYKVAPFFFAFALKKVEVDSKVEIPERILQFNRDFKAKVPETYKLLSDKEGMSIKELIDAKAGGPENNPVKEAKEVSKEDRVVANTTPVKTGGSGEVIIHGVTASMNCLGPLLLAKHTKVGSLKVCMPGEDSQSDEYKKKVPFGGVPGMEDGEWSMGESGAILRYLAREYAAELYPIGAEQRGRIDWAMDRFCSGMYNDCVATIYVAMGFADAPEQEEDLKAAGKKASTGLADFAKVFLTDQFVGGDKLSIADFKIAPFFCAYAHQRVQRKCFVKVPERIMEFNLAFAEACSESKLFQQAEGGFSIVEILNAKDKAEEEGKEQAEAGTPELDTMQKAMAEEAQQTVVPSEDKVPIVDNASAPMCGCF